MHPVSDRLARPVFLPGKLTEKSSTPLLVLQGKVREGDSTIVIIRVATSPPFQIARSQTLRYHFGALSEVRMWPGGGTRLFPQACLLRQLASHRSEDRSHRDFPQESASDARGRKLLATDVESPADQVSVLDLEMARGSPTVFGCSDEGREFGRISPGRIDRMNDLDRQGAALGHS